MIIGTAGHIDHGKTTLLQALTGQTGDRRREERERGMTIDLGYQYLDLGLDEPLGFIDVPGHERFIHNMLAGASGIDRVLLVVAADDGVMPQTREHLAIVELLGIPRALVAITKIDRVEPERVAEVAEDVRQLLAAGPYAGAPLFPLSAVSGEGVQVLRAALIDEAGVCRKRRADGHFRLAIDRAFSIGGAGTVVTGTAFAGTVSVGDELLLSPAGLRVRVRGLHAQNREARQARAGQRVALNLAGERVSPERINRGDWLLAPALHAPSSRLDVQLRLLPGARPLRHWTPVHVHLGAQDVSGRVALLEGELLEPGTQGLAQLVLNAPLHAVHGDALVLRDQSARQTLGGGRVLDPFAPSRQRRAPERLAQLRALVDGGLDSALPVLLAHAPNGLEPAVLERQFNHLPDRWPLPEGVLRIATRVGPRLFLGERWRQLGETLVAGLQRFHEEQPDELGPDRDRLRRYALPQLERSVFIARLEQSLASGEVASSGPWLHRPDHRVRLGEAEEALQARLWPLLEAGGFDPPWVRDLARETDTPETDMRLLLRKLARLGQLQQVVRDLFYPETTLRRAAQTLLALEAEQGAVRAAAFRDRIGLGRKRSIQLLEHFDRVGLTRRFGNERRVRRDSGLVGN
jgi:selenocysteine-specific elongation factor